MIATIIILVSIWSDLLFTAIKNGEDRGKYSFKTTLIASLIMITLYYYAGLFDVFIK